MERIDKWPVGDVLQNRFEIVENDRFGSFGIVYKVRDLVEGVHLAVKTYKNEFLWNREMIDLFVREAETWVDLERHENIVNALFIQMVRGKPCVFMEFIEGAPLRYFMHQNLWEQPLKINAAIQLCSGMAHAEEKIPGIVHRDLKPSNMLISLEHVLKIGDWGTAKTKAEIGDKIFGTPEYMSPEQFADYANVDVRSDIYSFGVVLYELFSGRLPFSFRQFTPGLTTRVEFYKDCHTSVVPQRLSVLDPAIPADLEALIMNCLQKDPAQRPTSFRSIKEELVRQFGQDVEIANKPTTDNFKYWINRSASLIDLQDFERALQACDRAIQLNPLSAEAWVNKSIAYRKLGEHDAALACLDEAIEKIPDDAIIWNNYGNSLSDLGRSEEALAAYDRAIELNGSYDRAWNNKGWHLLDSYHAVREAIDCFSKAIEINPGYSAIWNNMGIAYSRGGAYQKAIECFDQAIFVNPRNSIALSNKGGVLSNLGRHEEGLACCDLALEIRPDCYNSLNNKGVNLKALGRMEEALQYFDKAINEGVYYEEG